MLIYFVLFFIFDLFSYFRSIWIKCFIPTFYVCILVSRAYVVKLALSESKIVALILFTFHSILLTIWYIVERRHKIRKLRKYQLFKYSVWSYLTKGFEAALIDFFIPRCDRYRLDFLCINKCARNSQKQTILKKITPYLNCLVYQLIYLVENVSVILWLHYQSVSNVPFLSVWILFCCGCSLFGSALVIYDLTCRINNSPICDVIHDMRDVGKIHEYFTLYQVDEFKEDVKRYNLQNRNKIITYIIEKQNNLYRLKFIGNENQYEKALKVVKERRRRHLSTCSYKEEN